MAKTKISTCLVGIDPDIDKSGVAIKDVCGVMKLQRLTFFKLYERLSELKQHYSMTGSSVYVIIEAGWLNKKSNFHGNKWQAKNVGERIAKNVGENHQAGKKIVEMCEYLQLDYKLVRPSHGKMSPEIFERATGIKTKNQEEIDAGVLIL